MGVLDTLTLDIPAVSKRPEKTVTANSVSAIKPVKPKHFEHQ